ncbi:MAG: hypothetical protein KatS3mg124_0111 [Porticoccaceae bacterium]|nr:MAG: hypothetical protein KatS3mg124_0111 [Porticoccaceae bacterium]
MKRARWGACLWLAVCLGQVAAAEVRVRPVEYRADGLTFRGLYAWDEARATRSPGVLVVHEWWGLDEHVRRVAEALAAHGYAALAADLYGEGRHTEHPAEARRFAQAARADPLALERRFRAALAALAAQPATDPERLAAVGYCFGGAVVLDMARAGLPLAGVASFHGALAPGVRARPGQVRARILVLHGGADPLVPPEQVRAFEEEMRELGADYRLLVYPGARHGFTNPRATELGERHHLPLAYDPEADRASFAALLGFLAELWPAP